MAYKKLETGEFVIDWETGDPEGDRKRIFQAYTDFFNELIGEFKSEKYQCCDDLLEAAINVVEKWKISTDNQIDDFPRIWISRPE